MEAPVSCSNAITSSPSVSGNVALYPSLAMDGEVIGCAWYEHGSPEKPDRSDVWFAASVDAKNWMTPVNVSGGLSYNNGPTLTPHPEGGFLCAWHSWRPPGLEPFRADGDVCNVWMARIHADGMIGRASLALPAWSRTEYPSLALWRDRLVLACSERHGGRILVSFSQDGRDWSDPWICPQPTNDARMQWPSITVTAEGICYLSAVSEREKRLCLFHIDYETIWPVGSFEAQLPANQHPKIRSMAEGVLAVSAYSSNWGSFSEFFDIEVERSPLAIELSPQGGAGREHWTLNYIDLVDKEGKRIRYNLGPFHPENDGMDVVDVRSDGSAPPDAKAAFSGPVDGLLRELGSPWTRGLVHGRERVTLRIALAPGAYTMNAVHSSWMASQPCTTIELKNARVLHHRSIEPEADACYVYPLDTKALKLGAARRVSPMNCNRSSQVLILPDGRVLMAWVDWNGAHTSIRVGELAVPEIF